MLATMVTFGEQLKTWASSQKLSMYKVSKLTGISQSKLSSLIAGRFRPSDEVIDQLTVVPGLSKDLLLSWLAIADFGPEAIVRAHLELVRQGHLTALSCNDELKRFLEDPEPVQRQQNTWLTPIQPDSLPKDEKSIDTA